MAGDDVLPPQIHMKGGEKKKKKKKQKKKKGTTGDMSRPRPDCHDMSPPCEVCHRRFPDNITLQIHRENVHVLHICEICGLSFYSDTLLQTHKQCVHTLHTCEICGVSFRSDAQLQSHRKSKHPDLKKKKMMKKKKKKKRQKKKKKNEEEEEEEKAKAEGEHASSFPIEKTMNKAPSPSSSISGESFPIEKMMNKAPSPSISGESFPMEKVDQAESILIMVKFDMDDSFSGAIYEIKLDQLQPLEHGKSVGGFNTDPSTLPMLKPVAELFGKGWKTEELFLFDCARIGSLSKLYVLVNQIPCPYLKPVTPEYAFAFDKSLVSELISPPKTTKQYCLVISAYGMLYYLAQPLCFPQIQEPSFERYDPASDSWESLPPFPDYSLDQAQTEITGYAVCYGYILLSMQTEKKYEAVAFHIHSRTWHKVKTSPENPYYYPFYGRAVVLGSTIYALAHNLDLVLVFSFWWDSDKDGDIVKRRHFLGTPLSLLITAKCHPPRRLLGDRTQNLVHLGGRYFCVVQTGQNIDSSEYQYMCATTFRIAGDGQEMHIKTVRSSVFRVAIEGNDEFEVQFSFTPDCNDIEPVEEQYCVSSALVERESAWTSDVKEDFFSFPTGPKLGLEAFRAKKEDEKKVFISTTSPETPLLSKGSKKKKKI
ncbi:putative transcription factor C2H2 family [Rosa chinensis]|uniref:Putative transcription factor C2H2 family n=1 Tax=Rosa chinensis TaxID=74649 RepID=A0A2P6SNJ0_ROSCH|nr:uncharacterized protein LOC112182554 isoform X1 [Rosa chinensis]XP_024176859.1 uncharacterized protein LOC112182588 isoform X1 [Rosa chinensis]PRQ60258.1 putative transcription factor C2H2 family [Rosa chinensis]PRQ60272.1 putative transcription factor C2H2 family [Rosa chinensis]